MNEVPVNVKKEFDRMSVDDRVKVLALVSKYSPQCVSYAANQADKAIKAGKKNGTRI
jgi:predicted metallopeptidase